MHGNDSPLLFEEVDIFLRIARGETHSGLALEGIIGDNRVDALDFGCLTLREDMGRAQEGIRGDVVGE
jgi:hypothetical protein